MAFTSKMKGKFQLTVPSALCKKLNIKVGDFLNMEAENGVIKVTPMKLVERKRAA